MNGKKKGLILYLSIVIVCLQCACGTGHNSEPPAPFSSACWECSVSDISALEGDSDSTYDSIYGGTTFSYPKEYNGHNGTVKYMFNENDELMCIAWAYNSDDENEVYAVYDEINQAVNKIHGDSGYQADSHSSNYGNVWYLESGDIVLSTMITSENEVLQYAYLNPAVSNTAAR